jgi:hypothetical protein
MGASPGRSPVMIRLILLLVLIAFIAAIKFLPWWGIVLFLVAVVLSIRYLGPLLLKTAFMTPFKMKGAVLRGASATVHSIVPTEAPPEPEMTEHQLPSPDDEDDEGDDDADDDDEDARPTVSVPHDYYLIDVTISPAPTPGPFQFWDPSDLVLVPFDAKADMLDDDGESSLAGYEVYQDGAFGPDEGGKYHGEQRLRMTFGVPRGGPRRRKFRYYFEAFGDVELPVGPKKAEPDREL